jgi:8-oxo-dGTP pyrophosphatase MutT (NUDIX family)
MTDAIPAATLILFRTNPDGDPDAHLFVERAATMVFAGGAIVFPGGRVDAGDRELATAFPDLDPDDAAARVAAIRETIEEAGVAIGLSGDCDAETIAKLRAHLHGGTPFADALAAFDLALNLTPLTYFARWCPNFKETRTFDTRFYIARMPEDAPAATVDATENVRLFWASAAHAIAESDAGRVKAIFPTRRNLERLAALRSFEAAREQAASIAPVTITPWIEEDNGTSALCIPEGLGYPVTREVLTTAMRG